MSVREDCFDTLDGVLLFIFFKKRKGSALRDWFIILLFIVYIWNYKGKSNIEIL